jgi:hypothetical protein
MPERANQEFLQHMLAQQHPSIAHYQFHDQKVWIKKANQHNSIWLYRLAGLGAKLLGIAVLAPVPSTGGSKAILTEVERLKTLAAQHINVPKVLAYNQQGLMISDMGKPEQPAQQLDSTLLRHATAAQCWSYFCKTVDAILATHQQRMWLSEAFIRNILIDHAGNIGFVDFETDPGDYLSQELCYARDWLFFSYSVAIRMQQHALLTQAADYLKLKLALEHPSTQAALHLAYSRLCFISRLPVHYIGKDGKRLASAAQFFRLLL